MDHNKLFRRNALFKLSKSVLKGLPRQCQENFPKSTNSKEHEQRDLKNQPENEQIWWSWALFHMPELRKRRVADFKRAHDLDQFCICLFSNFSLDQNHVCFSLSQVDGDRLTMSKSHFCYSSIRTWQNRPSKLTLCKRKWKIRLEYSKNCI